MKPGTIAKKLSNEKRKTGYKALKKILVESDSDGVLLQQFNSTNTGGSFVVFVSEAQQTKHTYTGTHTSHVKSTCSIGKHIQQVCKHRQHNKKYMDICNIQVANSYGLDALCLTLTRLAVRFVCTLALKYHLCDARVKSHVCEHSTMCIDTFHCLEC